jgi:hypothetical protein
MKHPGHTYGGFIPAISERGMTESYGHVGPFGLCHGTFDGDVINLPIIMMTLSLGVKVGIGTSSNCKDCTICAESINLLWRFLDLRWRWRWWIGFGFDLRVGVLWHGVCDLWH